MRRFIIGVLALALAGCASGLDKGREISVISREDGSGTRGAFIELFGIIVRNDDGTQKDLTTKEAVIANKTDVMLQNIAGDPCAIGYVSIGSLSDAVKALTIDGAEPSSASVASGEYKVVRPFIAATRAQMSPLAQDFLGFVLSKEGQKIVSASYIAVDTRAEPFAGAFPGGKIVIGGSSSVTPVMEKLAEAYKALNENATLEIQMTDSSAGMSGTIEGILDIGMSSRELKDSERASLNDTVIALDGIAVIVNKDNPISGMRSDMVRAIFTGEKIRWAELYETKVD